MIEFTCECGKRLAAKEENAGRVSRCLGCGKSLVIPVPVVEEEEDWSAGASGRDYAYWVLAMGLAPMVLLAARGTFGGGHVGGAVVAKGGWGMAWLLGAGAWAGFMGLVVGLMPEGWGRRKELLIVAGSTAVVGLGFLLLAQFIAGVLRGWIIEGAGPFAFPFMAMRYLAGSFDEAAINPKANYWICAFVFTVGVGLVEACVAALPVIWNFMSLGTLGWRGAMVWGMAAGVGLGAAEGIGYAASFDLGGGGLGLLARFVSCVAVHAVLAGSVGIFVYQQRKALDQMVGAMDFINVLLGVIVVAILLHGQFDTLMKMGIWWGAAGVGGVAVAVLAGQVAWLRREEPRTKNQEPNKDQ